MAEHKDNNDGRAVPSGRVSRLAGLGGMTAGIAGNMALGGIKQFATGKRPTAAELLMTPANAAKLTYQLANMRGAAMKIGQMISMDSGDFLPKEFADILARLRSDAQHMPTAQLYEVLKSEYGARWRSQFASFEPRPIAAASIGQVHKATTKSGDTLAIKIQYPGVRESIDSDIKNVASLLRVSGLVPSNLDMAPLIEEARRQLHQEADYAREASYLSRFSKILEDNPNFEVPKFYPEVSTDRVLAMSYIESCPIEDMGGKSQAKRDTIASRLMELVLQELFVFGMMQTDPNFANYRYNTQDSKIVLLDFGASRDIEAPMTYAYKALMQAALSGSSEACLDAATKIGFLPKDIPRNDRSETLALIDIALEPLANDAPFDFGSTDIVQNIRTKAMGLASNRDLWHLPPPATVFIQRKLGGTYLLATRLRAKVNVRALLERYVGNSP